MGWGSNWSGESRGTDASGMPIEGPPDGLPVRIGGVVLSGISQITATGGASLALRSDGTVVAWGAAPAPSPSGLSGVRAIAGGNGHAVALLEDAPSDCAGIGAAGVATLARSGGYWQDIQAWSWTDGGWRVPGSASDVRLRGSVANECAAACATLTVDAGSTLIVTPAASAPGSDLAVRVGTRATLGGRLWLLGLASGATELPSDPAWKLPVLSVASSGSLQGTFDLLQTEVPPPAGHFVTLGAEAAADGRTVLSFRVLPLAPGGGALDPRTPGSFTGAAIAAEAIDLDGDLLDDLALAVDFGPSQPGLLQVLMNDGAGRLGGTSVTRSLPSQPTCLAVGDVDGDGRRDIVVGLAGPSGSGSVQVFLADGQGGLVPGLAISPIAGGPTAVVVIPPAGAGALPGPGWIGVGTSASKMRIYLNGSLQQEVAMAGVVTSARGGRVGAEGTRGRDIATGGTRSSSIEGIAAPETGFVQLLRPLGDGSLGAGPEMLLTARPVGMDFADLDGDGRDDIVTANADPVAAGPGSALPVLSIFRNNDGSFTGGVPFQPSDASAGLSVTLVDADGDGDRDIVSVHATAGGDSEASLLRVDTLGAGTPIAIGQTIDLPATGPTLSARGNLDATAGEDLVLIDGTPSSGLVPQFGVRPYLAPGVSRPADLDGSGTVDFGDVTLAMLDFGPCTGCVADLDRSGTVDFGDVVLILLDFG